MHQPFVPRTPRPILWCIIHKMNMAVVIANFEWPLAFDRTSNNALSYGWCAVNGQSNFVFNCVRLGKNGSAFPSGRQTTEQRHFRCVNITGMSFLCRCLWWWMMMAVHIAQCTLLLFLVKCTKMPIAWKRAQCTALNVSDTYLIVIIIINYHPIHFIISSPIVLLLNICLSLFLPRRQLHAHQCDCHSEINTTQKKSKHSSLHGIGQFTQNNSTNNGSIN